MRDEKSIRNILFSTVDATRVAFLGVKTRFIHGKSAPDIPKLQTETARAKAHAAPYPPSAVLSQSRSITIFPDCALTDAAR